MRLGEVKQIIDRALSDSSTLIIHHDPLYGGQAEKVTNYGEVIAALAVLEDRSWSGINVDTLSELKSKHSGSASAVITQEEFNKLNDMVNGVNQKMPLFYSILDEMVAPQDEKTINIMLPSGIKSLENLSAKNKSINQVLKLYNIDGQFDFQRFDFGTDWYVVSTVGLLSYNFLISGLNIAQKYFEAKKAYWESKTAEIEYLAAHDKESVTAEELDGFRNRKLTKLIQYEVKQALAELGVGANNENELETKLVKATTALIKELDEGVEFHLSLNPPSYVRETSGSISIDYTQIKPLIAKKDEPTKQLAAPEVNPPVSGQQGSVNE